MSIQRPERIVEDQEMICRRRAWALRASSRRSLQWSDERKLLYVVGVHSRSIVWSLELIPKAERYLKSKARLLRGHWVHLVNEDNSWENWTLHITWNETLSWKVKIMIADYWLECAQDIVIADLRGGVRLATIVLLCTSTPVVAAGITIVCVSSPSHAISSTSSIAASPAAAGSVSKVRVFGATSIRVENIVSVWKVITCKYLVDIEDEVKKCSITTTTASIIFAIIQCSAMVKWASRFGITIIFSLWSRISS